MKNSLTKRIISICLCVIIAILSISVTAFAADVTVSTPPTKTVYYQGKDWNWVDGKISVIGGIDLSGIKLSYLGRTYSYYVDEIFGPNIYTSTSHTWSEGDNIVDVKCDDINSGIAKLTLKFVAISKIEIVSTPVLTDLMVGTHWKKGALGDVELSSYDLSGLKLNVFYKDSTTAQIVAPNSALSWSVDPSLNIIYPGPNKLYVTYAGFSAKFDVNFIENEPSYALGDVNEDTKISSYDALMVLEYSVGMISFNNTQLKLANVNKDSLINSTDALYILQMVVGLRTSF